MALSGFFAIGGTVGADINHTRPDQEFDLGTIVRLSQHRGDEENIAIYVRANTALTKSATCVITTGFTASAFGGGGYQAMGSFSPGDYGWLRNDLDPE